MEFGSMPCCRRATNDEAPKSIVKRIPPASTRMQVWKRPPLPKESPEPTNRTVAVTLSPPPAAGSSSATRSHGTPEDSSPVKGGMYHPAMRMPIGLPPAGGHPFDAVGFGLNMTDLLVVVERFPEPDSKQPVRRQAYSPGGQAASAMVACARLGWRARYVGCFGDDENGRQGRSSLADEGVDISACRVASDTRNGMSVILVDERTGERTVLWSRDSGLKLRPEDVDPAAVGAGRLLLVDCHDTAASTSAAHHARRAGTRTVIDVERVRDGIDALLAEIDIIITARDFPASLTGKGAPGAALRAIHDAYRPALVCMTLGAEGSLALVGDVEIRTPGVPRAGRRHHRRRRRLPRRVHLGMAPRRRRRGGRGRAPLCERGGRAQVPRPGRP